MHHVTAVEKADSEHLGSRKYAFQVFHSLLHLYVVLKILIRRSGAVEETQIWLVFHSSSVDGYR